MEPQEGKFVLDASSPYYPTEDSTDVYRVLSGTVLVYIAPLEKGKPVNYRLFCEVEQGRLIPAFSCKDSFRQFNFYLKAKSSAETSRNKHQRTAKRADSSFQFER